MSAEVYMLQIVYIQCSKIIEKVSRIVTYKDGGVIHVWLILGESWWNRDGMWLHTLQL